MDKTTLTKQRLSALFLLLISFSLVFTGCSSDDDSPVKPEPVVEEFEEIEDLEPVVDEEPVITEPETGKVAESEATLGIIADVLGATASGEIAEETRTNLAEVGDFAETLPAEVTEYAADLDAAAVESLFDPAQELPAVLEQLQENLESLPTEITNLLPTINFTSDFEGMAVKTSLGSKSIVDVVDGDVVSQVFGSCAEANRDAFDAVIEKLTVQRDDNLAIVDGNYTRRLAEADSRYADRVALQATNYEANLASIKATVLELLHAASNAETLGDAVVAGQLRTLALFYSLKAKSALAIWDEAVQSLLIQFQSAEKDAALVIKNQLTAEVNAAFTAAKEEAEALLADALGNCHNQGGGN